MNELSPEGLLRFSIEILIFKNIASFKLITYPTETGTISLLRHCCFASIHILGEMNVIDPVELAVSACWCGTPCASGPP